MSGPSKPRQALESITARTAGSGPLHAVVLSGFVVRHGVMSTMRAPLHRGYEERKPLIKGKDVKNFGLEEQNFAAVQVIQRF